VKDGLAGSTVYDLCQDKEGFIWFATDAGVSRFDGTHFKNFTLDDGLPSNEILRVFSDTKGRIWMAPFKKTICYYYKGRIHTQENDTLLSQVKLSEFTSWFAEDNRGDIMIQAGEKLAYLKNAGGLDFHVTNFYLKDAASVTDYVGGEGFLVATLDTIFYVKDGKFSFFFDHQPLDLKENLTITFADLKSWSFEKKLGIVNLDIKGLKLRFVNTDNGSWEMDTVTMKYIYLHLPGKTVTHVIRDDENNIWFATLGHGVFKLVSKIFLNYRFENSQEPEIYSIEKWNNTIVAGSTFSSLYTIKDSGITYNKLDQHLENKWLYNIKRNRIYCLKKTSRGQLLIGQDALLMSLSQDAKPVITWIPAIKSLYEINDSIILVGGKNHAITVRPSDLKHLDTIWYERSTAVYYTNNEYYIGTTDGCFVVQKDKSSQSLGKLVPVLNSHISQIVGGTDNIIWIATYGKGVIGIKDKKQVVHITTQEGLSSNICRTLTIKDNTLWVGTDKGLNKIDISQPGDPAITTYTTADGLASNIVNAVFADGNEIYIGSPSGLTYFDKSKVAVNSKSRLKILSVRIGNKVMPVDSAYTISYKENSIKLDFTCISFRSEGDIIYKYRLKGLTNDWDSTRSTSLEYASLPSGTFEFEIIAINKFGLQSNMETIRFVVNPPLWKTVWFRILAIAIIVGLAWLIVMMQFNRFKKKEREKSNIRQQLNELEQKALRAQMNPHFIFNCLSSIQSFIITKDFETTNNYLTEFARLIRQTLDNSEKTSISIENEVRYLSSYIDIERMRYGHSFDYTIEVSPEVKQDFTYIPNMILQPYVENCIRHGLRHNEMQGLIQIKFRQTESELTCIVEDNGIGRKKAAEYKSRIRIEYQSRGMKLTEERINLLNKNQDEKIKIEVVDLEHPDGEAGGTKVIIHFPTTILKKLM
jgi:two-component sensor histidine kinase